MNLDAVTVAGRAAQVELQPVVGRFGFIVEQQDRSFEIDGEQIDSAVIIEVARRRATADDGLLHLDRQCGNAERLAVGIYVLDQPAGPQHMTGGEALIYARSRHRSQDGDFDRGRRQQRVLLSLREQMNALTDLATMGIRHLVAAQQSALAS